MISDFGSANLARVAKTMVEGAIVYAAPETIPQAYDSDTAPPPKTTKRDVYMQLHKYIGDMIGILNHR